MARKALLVASNTFRDSAFEGLTYPLSDAERFAGVLRDPNLCFFDDVEVLTNPTLDGVRRAVFSVTGRAARDDLVLLYFSGHGSLDKDGSLALVLPETERDLLAATSLVADDLKRAFNLSHAAQKVLILDCCYAGAVGPSKMKGSATDSVAALAESASGSFILTASTKFQPAFERPELGGSVLTSCLVDGVSRGEAAPDGEIVTLSALAAYTKARAPILGGQQPQYWDFGSTGDVLFARRPLSFDALWRGQVSQLIAQHHADGNIDYEMQEQIRAVIVAPTDDANRPSKELIDQLRRGKIGLARFGSAWAGSQLGAAMPARSVASSTPRAPPVQEAETPAPELQQAASAAQKTARSRTPPSRLLELWLFLKGNSNGWGPGRYMLPVGALVAGVALLASATVGEAGSLPGVIALLIICLGLLFLQVRIVFAPGAGMASRAIGAFIGSVAALSAGSLTIYILYGGLYYWSESYYSELSTSSSAWSVAFGILLMLALRLIYIAVQAGATEAGSRQTGPSA